MDDTIDVLKALSLILTLIVVGARVVRWLVRSNADPSMDSTENPRPDDSRPIKAGAEQLTGKRCEECRERIMIGADGRRCKKCSAVLHKNGCSKRHKARVHPVAPPAFP